MSVDNSYSSPCRKKHKSAEARELNNSRNTPTKPESLKQQMSANKIEDNSSTQQMSANNVESDLKCFCKTILK
mgnify:CR=1 FL=1